MDAHLRQKLLSPGVSDDSATPADRPRSLMQVTARLATANFSLLAISLLTGPLQARALGPTGRGELAAIAVPATLIPTITSVGLGSFAIFATAKGRDVGALLGTMGALLACIG